MFLHTGLFQGVDVNAQINGRLPMHYAADYGQGEVIEYLLSKGAKINVRLTVIAWKLPTCMVYDH